MVVAAVVEADKGVFISEYAMMAWMDRLEDDIDAEPPAPDVFLTADQARRDEP
jgi:hypothetical protein